jgi:hypothetical protein
MRPISIDMEGLYKLPRTLFTSTFPISIFSPSPDPRALGRRPRQESPGYSKICGLSHLLLG